MAQAESGQFERIVLPHLDAAYNLARYLVRDEHDAQDVVQDAALRAVRHFDGFADGDPRSWLLAIVRNCSLDHHRRRRGEARGISLDSDDSPEIAGADATDELAIRSSDRGRIQRAVESLPFEYKEVIVLREVEEMSYKEISAVIGAPIGTVMSRLARARKQLATLLGAGAQEAG